MSRVVIAPPGNKVLIIFIMSSMSGHSICVGTDTDRNTSPLRYRRSGRRCDDAADVRPRATQGSITLVVWVVGMEDEQWVRRERASRVERSDWIRRNLLRVLQKRLLLGCKPIKHRRLRSHRSTGNQRPPVDIPGLECAGAGDRTNPALRHDPHGLRSQAPRTDRPHRPRTSRELPPIASK
jgi:hypothetical protein